jgi:hypothetical protein
VYESPKLYLNKWLWRPCSLQRRRRVAADPGRPCSDLVARAVGAPVAVWRGGGERQGGRFNFGRRRFCAGRLRLVASAHGQCWCQLRLRRRPQWAQVVSAGGQAFQASVGGRCRPRPASVGHSARQLPRLLFIFAGGALPWWRSQGLADACWRRRGGVLDCVRSRPMEVLRRCQGAASCLGRVRVAGMVRI